LKKYILILLLIWVASSESFVFYENTKIWNQDSILFHFLDGTEKQKNEVKKFSQLWQKYIGIKFRFSNTKPSSFSFQKYYKITFKGGSNQSTRGAINGIIHLGDLSDDIIFRKSTILHEFGHMLGLGHEHQRIDRPTSLNNKQLIFSCIKIQKQPKAWCEENLSNIMSDEVFIESKYDSLSIMHYALKNIVGDNTKLLNYLPDTGSNTLSYTDKYYIAMLYNQDISDKTLEQMHKQDLWNQQKFERAEKDKKEKSILSLKSNSCKPLSYKDQSADGKFCKSGFMVIGKDNLSFPELEFKTCSNNYKMIKNIIKTHPYCQLSSRELSKKRQLWSDEFSQYGQCRRLDSNTKNKQEYFCKEGFSFVTKNNDMVGKKTECFSSQESVYQAMQENSVCNMNDLEYRRYESRLKKNVKSQMITKYCQIVTKKYKSINCPLDFDYTIIDRQLDTRPINNQCFSSKYQAINAMKNMPFCQS
jgi:hypothetical protein